MPTLYTMVAPCFFGTESTLNFEVKRLGAQNIQVTDGRVAFQGGADIIAAANLNLRTAERVLLLLATYKATTFDELFDGCYNIAWEELLPADAATVLTNPPYGERLGDAGEAAALAKTLGQVWQRHPAQGLYAITADADFEQHFGKKAARRRKIYNGMIPCQLYMYFEQPKREKR